MAPAGKFCSLHRRASWENIIKTVLCHFLIGFIHLRRSHPAQWVEANNASHNGKLVIKPTRRVASFTLSRIPSPQKLAIATQFSYVTVFNGSMNLTVICGYREL